MIFAVWNSLISLFWAIIMCFLTIYVFGIIFANRIAYHFQYVNRFSDQQRQHATNIATNFGGDLGSIMISLTAAISGGNDWMVYGEELQKVGTASFYLFVVYIAFSVIGLMNVVTGIFVDSAIYTRTDDEIVQTWQDDLRRTSEAVKKVFARADLDNSGTVSLEELRAQMQHPLVRAYFSGLEIEPEEVNIIFTLLDVDNNGAVTIDEFVHGVMKLKGKAKAIDVVAMMADQAHYGMQFDRLCAFVEETMLRIQSVITPSTDPPSRMFPQLAECVQAEYLPQTFRNSYLSLQPGGQQ
jgi:hypothetical protein